MVRSFEIKVPCSSANIGPGYDVLGIGLSMYLTIDCTIDSANIDSISYNNNCIIEYTKDSEGYESVPLEADKNLITKTALYVLRCNNIRSFPTGTKLTINNPIPLGRGLGSSGAAVVAGVMLGSEVGQLDFDKQRMLDFCLMIERHPDNISAAMMGGFVGSFLRDLSPAEVERREIPLSEVFSDLSSGGEDTGLSPPLPPQDIGRHLKYQWNEKIKCVAIIPNFEVSTADSRGVLPKAYTTNDVVFNLQRLSILTTALTLDPPNPDLIYPAMQDRLHQPYRKTLIPGLPQILQSVTPKTHKGLLGICLSGAGPTILALATENFDDIAAEIINEFKKKNIECDWKLLTLADDGATIIRK
ncbi:homoserine kinase [Hanseniaspora valbyensis NRRL Y-1626]|uniref:Homoserine kinase n=1 Tax=Hanseniaspora valbyensis NRRL Y-1626 TaxID=766949 RepID=A0A1B7TCT3_9ASCO|nr:homoserine kinase [Hanseniaspora valbyensis NRRL Y-1626]